MKIFVNLCCGHVVWYKCKNFNSLCLPIKMCQKTVLKFKSFRVLTSAAEMQLSLRNEIVQNFALELNFWSVYCCMCVCMYEDTLVMRVYYK